jgi:deoxycytidylate deaminase
MKTDNYLNLCLKQAAKSPLRYRHGAIVVRGGKVIGQGYNDYRTGFDGGALKTGRLPLRSLDGPAIAELKRKHKLKREPKLEPGEETTKTFTPFEIMAGGGKLANTPLSMHSEMMAIHSALSVTSTVASSAVSSQKPCFKLSGGDKRKARLRRDAIKSYVETVCKQALLQSSTKQGNGKSQVQEWRFESATSGPRDTQSCVSSRGQGREGAVVHGEQYGETPNEREEESSSQSWQQVQQWTTQTTTPTVCV